MTEKPDLEVLLSAILESVPDLEQRHLLEMYLKNPENLSKTARNEAAEILKQRYPEIYHKIHKKKSSWAKPAKIAGAAAVVLCAYFLGEIDFKSKEQDSVISAQAEKIQQLESEKKKIDREYSELISHISSMEERLGDYGIKNGRLGDEITTVLRLLTTDITEFVRQRRQYEQTIEESKAEILRLQQARDSAQTEKKNLEGENTRQKTSLDAAETRNRTLEQQARELLETQSSLNTQIKKIQGEYEIISREKQEMSTTLQRYEEELKKYKTSNGSLEQEIQKAKKTIDEHVEYIKKIEEASKKIEQEKAELEKTNARLDQMLFTGLTIYHRVKGKDYHYLDFPFYYQDGTDARRVISSEKYYITAETAKKLNAAELLSSGEFRSDFSRLWIKVEGPASSKKYNLIAENSVGREIQKKAINEQAVIAFIKSVLLAHMEGKK